MKKFLLTLMVLGVTASSASAYYEVNYMNTGAVKNFTPVRFGQNAPIGSGPQHDEYSYRAREVKRYNAITKAIENQNNYNINLNVNKNNNQNIQADKSPIVQENSTPKLSKTKVAKKTFSPVSCNGITYYNQNNPCSL